MDLLPKARCRVCEKIFCCPDHRRKHETVAHGLLRRRLIRIRTESYALEMRRSSSSAVETKRAVLTRKRKIVTTTMTTRSSGEPSNVNLEIEKRKVVLAARTKAKNDSIEMPSPLTTKVPHSASRKKSLTDLLSPVEKNETFVAEKKPKLAQEYSNEAHSQRDTDFITSTPIQKKTHTDVDQQTPQSSTSKRMWSIWSNKGELSTSGDSLYTTARDDSSPKIGILSVVAGSLHAAFASLGGGQQKKDEYIDIGNIEKHPVVYTGKSPIQGRRPLRPYAPGSFRKV